MKERWGYASHPDAEEWQMADSRDQAIEAGTREYEGAAFYVAPMREIWAGDFVSPGLDWCRLLDDTELPDQAIGALTDAVTPADEGALLERTREVFAGWLRDIVRRDGFTGMVVDTAEVERVQPEAWLAEHEATR